MKKTYAGALRFGSVLLLLYALYIFFARWTQFAFSGYTLLEFDGALRMLPHYYIREGFIPYRDFGVVYPPGLFLLIGKVIPFVSMFQRNLILALLELVLLAISWLLLYTIPAKNKRTLLPVALLIMLETIILEELAFGEPFSGTLLFIVILLLAHYMTNGRKALAFCALLVSGLVVWFRWNSIVLLVATQLIIVAGWSLYRYLRHSPLSDDLKKIWGYVALEVVGVAAGIGLLLVYLAAIGALGQGVDFIFTIPTGVILEYRMLPLPRLQSIFTIYTFVFCTALAVLVVHIAYVLRAHRKPSLLFFSLTPFFIISYTLGRADQAHIWPFYYFVGLSVIITQTMMHRIKPLFFLMVMLFVPTYFYFLPVKPYLQTTQPLLYTDLSQKLSDCAENISHVGDYRSLFVGRLSYRSFIVSVASLYLINPHVKPATAFISDEPGLQNSLTYGARIAQELKNAPKPMVAFLEIGQQPPEPNKTQFMRSEGKIEEVLAASRFQVVGVCRAYDRNFVIRLYN